MLLAGGSVDLTWRDQKTEQRKYLKIVDSTTEFWNDWPLAVVVDWQELLCLIEYLTDENSGQNGRKNR
jgi:hypothetical protein